MKPFKRVDKEDIAVFEKIMPGRVFTGDAILDDYDHDEMTEYGHYIPEAVLQALSAEEISKVMVYCNRQNIAVTPRGAGTGLCGGCVAKDGGIVLTIEKMNRVLEVDVRNMAATVEPGVLLIDFPKALEGTGLFYPPDPGEKTATMGGNAMTNAGGMRAVRFGVTRDYVLGMKVVLASGEILELGGKVVKNSSGYSLIDLMVGSEGTLGILTQLTVKLIPEPKVNLSILAPFEDLDKCIDAVPAVLACGCEPTAVEFMEREVIGAAEQYLGKQFPDISADAYLLVRLDGPSRTELDPSLDILTDLLLSLGAKDVLLADTDERKESIWNARGAFLEAIKGGTPSMDECDVVVPRDKIAEFVRKSILIGKELDIRIRSFGHAGDGNLHIYACKDNLADDIWKEKCSQVMKLLYTEAHILGGQVSGEHGIGHAKVGFLRDALGDTQIGLMRGIRQVFDPNLILNPGKVMTGGDIMPLIPLPFGNEKQILDVDECVLKAVICTVDEKEDSLDEKAVVLAALECPVGSCRLRELAADKKRILVITSDHTRPVPSHITLPLFLEEIRHGNPQADIRILVATGMHRATTRSEMESKFGADLIAREKFIIHEATNTESMTYKGVLPSGGELWLNSQVDWADLVISEGFIEPHFFAGFSGGRKSILPGIASEKTVLYNHNAKFITDPASVQGSLEGNLLHRDMLYAAKIAGLAFILNVLIDGNKKIVAAYAGNPEKAHEAGCRHCMRRTCAPKQMTDIVVTTNGGYPLDQNLYQSVKGMSLGAMCVREGGILIMLAECADGHGGECFYHWLADRENPAQTEAEICSILPENTVPDQWEAQILARILRHCICIFVTLPRNRILVEKMHMRYAASVGEALAKARAMLGTNASVCVIPDGVGTIVR